MDKWDLYMFKVYAKSKWLFLVLMAFCVATIFFALLSKEQFPVLLYGMYSLPEKVQKEYTAYRIEISGKPVLISNLPDSRKEVIQTSLEHAIDNYKQNKISNDDWLKFIGWLFSYCKKTFKLRGNTIRILECKFSYVEGKPSKNSEKVVYVHEY